ncbi:MAG: hypothetical protein CMJ83_19640 [Planctomycetes bacterium]|nr:hypothetical protein [Planctomycetota bacterium]
MTERWIALTAAGLLAGCMTVSACAQGAADFTPDVWGIERAAEDPAAMVRFYEALGFRTVKKPSGESGAVLRSDALRLVVTRRAPGSRPPDAAFLGLNVRVPDLRKAAVAVRNAGGTVPDPEPAKFVLGHLVRVSDPGGHVVSLVDLDGRPLPDDRPRVFNISVSVPDLDASEAFFTKLGFRVFSRDWLPRTLPLHRDGAAPLVLHPSAARVATGKAASLLLGTPDLPKAHTVLCERGAADSSANPRRTEVGHAISLRPPSGIGMKLVGRSLGRRAFDRLQAVAGTWRCSSTKGWKSRVSLQSIARGTVLAETDDQMNAHPGEAMLTVFHMDGERLLLTHYCVAGNQPRLVATAFDEKLDEIRFEFLDGTDLPSRDVGHMDSCVYRFSGPDTYTTRWSWYQDGKARPMETITHRRTRR